MKKSNHYVDNVKFLDALRAYRSSCMQAKRTHTELPQMPEFIGECFLAIATHLSYKPNFVNYTYRDDMISDGVENCLVYALNFDPDKSSNPFGYFTQIVYFAFVRRIQKEKKHTYIKYKAIEQSIINGGAQNNGGNGNSGAPHMQADTTMLNFDNVKDFIVRFDDSAHARRERRRSSKQEKTLDEVLA